MRAALGSIITGCLVLSACGSQDKSTPPKIDLPGVAVPASLTTTQLPFTPSTPTIDPKTAWKDGVTRYESGDFTGAATSLTVAADGHGDPYRSYLLGLARFKSGDLAGAETALVASVTKNPSSLKGWINLARVRNERSDRSGALDAAEKALGIDPTSADALHQKGRALMELGRRDEALEALKTAHDLDADNGYVANSLGLLLIQIGRPQDAVAPLEVAKARLPHVAYVRNNLGVAYERTGRMDEAKLEYQAAVDAGDMGGKGMKSLVRLGAKDTTDSNAVLQAAGNPAAEK
ncbi:MAG TPA: tetratricopeptide repeat protein [Candidatus Polarisedimenticolaceae bacterium]|nr:tetratricopeptide repeat protein [Candidatus Polarisedimenticolaceae bacterium]